MTLTIDIPGELEARLRQDAARLGVDAAEYVRRLIEDRFPPPRADEATLALLAQWDAEDATTDPAEIAARRAEWEEFERSMNASHSSNRTIYP